MTDVAPFGFDHQDGSMRRRREMDVVADSMKIQKDEFFLWCVMTNKYSHISWL